MELSTLCRVCMKTIFMDCIELDSPLNDKTYLECFNYCTKLNVFLQDALPRKICISCGMLLKIAYEFVKSAHEADNFLRKNFILTRGSAKHLDGIKHEHPYFVESLEEEVDIDPLVIGSSKQIKEETNCYEGEQTAIQPKFEVIFDGDVFEDRIEGNDLNLLSSEKDILSLIKQDDEELLKGEEVSEYINDDKNNKDAKSFKCQECNQGFLTYNGSTIHRAQTHKTGSQVCGLCGKSFENRISLNQHKIADHKGNLSNPNSQITQIGTFDEIAVENTDIIHGSNTIEENPIPVTINGSTIYPLDRLSPSATVKEIEMRIDNDFQRFITREGKDIFINRDTLKRVDFERIRNSKRKQFTVNLPDSYQVKVNVNMAGKVVFHHHHRRGIGKIKNRIIERNNSSTGGVCSLTSSKQ